MFLCHRHFLCRSPMRFCFSARGRCLNLAVEATESSFRFQGKYWKLACGSLASEMCFSFECRLALCRRKACRVFVDRELLERVKWCRCPLFRSLALQPASYDFSLQCFSCYALPQPACRESCFSEPQSLSCFGNGVSQDVLGGGCQGSA